MTARLVVLASGSGSNAQALLDASSSGELVAEVVAVVSNRPLAGALDRARRAGVPAVVVAPADGESRAAYDARLAEAVAPHAPDVVVLAGWMRILSMTFLGRWPGRVVNLHPARPGELPGANAIQRAYDEWCRGERSRTGVMVHLVPDEGVDSGPVLAAVDVAIEPDDTIERLEARIHAAEHRLLVDAVDAFVRELACDGARTTVEPRVMRS